MNEKDLSKNNLTEIEFVNNKKHKKIKEKILKKKSKFYPILITIIILIIVLFITVKYPFYKSNIISSRKIYTNKNLTKNILYVKSDSLLRKSPELTSDIYIILLKGTKLLYINETIEDDINKIKYDKVKVIKNNLYSKDYIGYINNEQISFNNIKEEKYSISIDSKTKIIKEAFSLLKSNNYKNYILF